VFSTGGGPAGVTASACRWEGESLEIVAAGAFEPLAIGVVYMKFFVDTADVAAIRDLAASGLLDWAKTGQSIL